MASNSLLDSLKNAKLLPSKVIPESFHPTFQLAVNFPTKSVQNGTLVRVSEVKSAPTIQITSDSSSSQSFTFMLIDPDAPTPDDPKFGYWRHWVVTNIQPSQPESSNAVNSGKVLTQYLAPGPKDESGPHRYLFLLFAEPEGWKVEKEDVGGEEFVERRSFRAGEWVEKHGLKLVGVQWMTGVGDGWKAEEKCSLV